MDKQDRNVIPNYFTSKNSWSPIQWIKLDKMLFAFLIKSTKNGVLAS